MNSWTCFIHRIREMLNTANCKCWLLSESSYKNDISWWRCRSIDKVFSKYRHQSHSEGKQNQSILASLSTLFKMIGKFKKEISGWYLRIKSHSKKHLVKSVFCRRDHCLNSKSYSLNTILWFLAVKLKPSKLEFIVQVQLMFKLQIIWRHPFCIPTDYSSCPFAVVSNSEHCDKLVKFITDASWVILPSLSQAFWTDNHWSLKSFYRSFSQNLLNSKRCSNVTISS